ncbi:hypothetical protein AB0M44_28230 [Streptosporangium subroseum]|uniref:hypothetical protein n=1 Tax=Streptosporangium subroseum TaxID=106412 RepID=UPI00341911BA
MFPEPAHPGLSELFADYTSDEIDVLSDWFTRVTVAMRTSLEEIQAGNVFLMFPATRSRFDAGRGP